MRGRKAPFPPQLNRNRLVSRCLGYSFFFLGEIKKEKRRRGGEGNYYYYRGCFFGTGEWHMVTEIHNRRSKPVIYSALRPFIRIHSRRIVVVLDPSSVGVVACRT